MSDMTDIEFVNVTAISKYSCTSVTHVPANITQADTTDFDIAAPLPLNTQPRWRNDWIDDIPNIRTGMVSRSISYD
jgi:hypothetical protein